MLKYGYAPTEPPILSHPFADIVPHVSILCPLCTAVTDLHNDHVLLWVIV